ncbi:hypothetical protein GGX14DRAFT_536071 [Mycena pura]|uniref:Integrase core domain-containing protein n=1 Tax=Mycena pura TaxID=153505 RepID=A0AAD6V875_9AGAR|nr:hypothetical protein GGX14DRAFT_536071 [Mycena pura]
MSCRSVHNICIEHLWCDVTRGFGRNAGLKPDLDAHIWLLHRLFLGAINVDALNWAGTWNEHKIRFDDETYPQPTRPNGLHGFEDVPQVSDEDDEIDDLETYSVDWEELHDADIIAHHTEHNADEQVSLDDLYNPFSNDGPHQLSHVEVAGPLCPFTPEEVALVDAHIAQYPPT